MRDYTTNNFCDYLWIGDLLELKQNDNREFYVEIANSRKPTKVKIGNVIIFGTIVEVKQVGCSGVLYHVDDGTGVIACKHSEDQFQEVIRSIEDEQADVSNQTYEHSLTDMSVNDSVFNDRSTQLEEINFNKKSRLIGLQSMWNDVFDSFHCLIEPYTIGDTVVIQGKLYSYVNMNQIYINNIRPMDIAEEIVQISIKLEDGLDKSNERETSKKQTNPVNRMSGLMTFDNIHHLNPKMTNPRSIQPPELRTEVLNGVPGIVTPNLETALTFDTFTTEGQPEIQPELSGHFLEQCVLVQVSFCGTVIYCSVMAACTCYKYINTAKIGKNHSRESLRPLLLPKGRFFGGMNCAGFFINEQRLY